MTKNADGLLNSCVNAITTVQNSPNTNHLYHLEEHSSTTVSYCYFTP